MAKAYWFTPCATQPDFAAQRRAMTFDTHGIALIGADGLNSIVRYDVDRPKIRTAYSNRTAWRATVPRDAVPEEFREPVVNLWLGRNAHLVHYPVKWRPRSTSWRSQATAATIPDWAATVRPHPTGCWHIFRARNGRKRVHDSAPFRRPG